MIKKILGNGSVYYNESKDSWVFDIRYTDEYNKIKRKSIGGVSEKDARKKGDDFIACNEISSNSYSYKTFDEVFALIVKAKKIKGTKEKSILREIQTYEKQLKDSLGNIQMIDLNAEIIQNALDDIAAAGYSDSVIKKSYDLIRQCWKMYMDRENIGYDPFTLVKIPKSVKNAKDIDFLSEEEIEKICDIAVNSYKPNGESRFRYGNVIVLLAYTGMRVGEALALTWDDVDFENENLSINKTSIEGYIDENGKKSYKPKTQDGAKTSSGNRVIPLHPRALKALAELKKQSNGSECVVSTSTGKNLNANRIYKTFMAIVSDMDIEEDRRITVHSLRHSFETMLINYNMDTKTASLYIGHSDERITRENYIHDKNRRAEDAMKNSKLFLN